MLNRPSSVFAALVTALPVAGAAFLLFVAAFHANTLIDPYVLYAQGVSLVFLPAGVKMVMLLIGRRAAAVGLFAGSVYLSPFVWADLQTLVFCYFAAASVFSYAAAAWLVCRYGGVTGDLDNLRYPHLVALSLLASVLNGISHNVIFWFNGLTADADFLRKSTAMVFGDFTGCFLVIFTLMTLSSMLRTLRPRRA